MFRISCATRRAFSIHNTQIYSPPTPCRPLLCRLPNTILINISWYPFHDAFGLILYVRAPRFYSRWLPYILCEASTFAAATIINTISTQFIDWLPCALDSAISAYGQQDEKRRKKQPRRRSLFSAKWISIMRSGSLCKVNSEIFWRPAQTAGVRCYVRVPFRHKMISVFMA